jgi:two-component system response regulator DesR
VAAEPDVPVSLIARRLHLSPGTVRNHLTAILAKLRAGSRMEAATVARDNGWL